MDRVEASCIPLNTIFDYLRDPNIYRPELSLKHALREVFGNNDALAAAMFALIQAAPSSGLCDKDKILAAHKERKVQKTEHAHFLKLKEAMDKVKGYFFKRHESESNSRDDDDDDEKRKKIVLRAELEPFFELVSAFIDMNLCYYDLQSLVLSSSSSSSSGGHAQGPGGDLEAKQEMLTDLQRRVDRLLYPIRPAKLLKERLDDLNDRLCA